MTEPDPVLLCASSDQRAMRHTDDEHIFGSTAAQGESQPSHSSELAAEPQKIQRCLPQGLSRN